MSKHWTTGAVLGSVAGRFHALAAVWVFAGAVGPCAEKPPTAAAPPGAAQPVASSRAQTLGASAEAAPPGASPESPPRPIQRTPTTRTYMLSHYADTVGMRKALVSGQLAEFHAAAKAVAEDEWTPKLRGDYRPYVDVLLVEVEAELPAAVADPSQLELVILNLALNGRDAMPHGGTLRIAVSRVVSSEADASPGWVSISVSDTGVGMDPETQRNIFKPFFTTKGASGHGLGLATVRSIVEQGGGRIEVTSAPERGSQFLVRWPAAVAGEEPSHRAPISLPDKDEALVRRALEHMLRGQDYAVLVASTGAEALEVFERERGQVDLLLCDVMRPGLSGLELTLRLRQQKASLPVLFMSGGGSAAVEAALTVPGSSLISKPFARDELRRKLEQLLGPRPSPEIAAAPVI